MYICICIMCTNVYFSIKPQKQDSYKEEAKISF